MAQLSGVVSPSVSACLGLVLNPDPLWGTAAFLLNLLLWISRPELTNLIQPLTPNTNPQQTLTLAITPNLYPLIQN